MFQLLAPEASGNGCSSQRPTAHEEHEVGYIGLRSSSGTTDEGQVFHVVLLSQLIAAWKRAPKQNFGGGFISFICMTVSADSKDCVFEVRFTILDHLE